jgi:RNA-directed DNA polymerase
MKAKLREIKETLRRHRHTPIDEQGRWLGTMMKGYFAYFAVPTNTYLLSAFRYHTSIIWFRSLRRRSQRHRLTWERMVRLIKRFLPSYGVDVDAGPQQVHRSRVASMSLET